MDLERVRGYDRSGDFRVIDGIRTGITKLGDILPDPSDDEHDPYVGFVFISRTNEDPLNRVRREYRKYTNVQDPANDDAYQYVQDRWIKTAIRINNKIVPRARFTRGTRENHVVGNNVVLHGKTTGIIKFGRGVDDDDGHVKDHEFVFVERWLEYSGNDDRRYSRLDREFRIWGALQD